MKNDLLNNKYIHILFIGILGLLIYSNTFHSPFIFDDARYIVDNPAVHDFQYFLHPSNVQTIELLPELKYAFRTRILGHFTFALNYKLNGLDVTGYHVFNLTIHIINSLLVYWLVLLTVRTPFFSIQEEVKDTSNILKDRTIIACFSALLFVSHPLQTQAVTYITQRFASLATLFYVLSVGAYVKSRISQATSARFVSYAIALSSAVLAMLTKEISFTLPVIIALYEIMFFDGKLRKRTVYLIPFFLTMSIIPLSLLAANSAGAASGDISESMRKLAISHYVSRWEYLVTQFRVIITYFRLLFLPVNQNLYYEYPVYRSFFNPSVLMSFLFLLTIFLSAVYCLYRSTGVKSEEKHYLRLLAFGVFWFFITLSMESSIIPIKDVIFEHRVYLPSIGFFIALIISFLMIIRKFNFSAVAGERITISILLSVVILLSSTTYARNIVWENEISLWEDVVRKSPGMEYNHIELASAYEKYGRTQDALREYQAVIQLNPANVKAHNNLGKAYAEQGRIEEAIKEFRTAISILPNYVESHYNLGVAYTGQGRTEDAIREYRTAIQLKPDYFKTHNNLANIYSKLGRTEDAINELLTAILIDPDQDQVHHNLGILFMQSGRFEEAAREFQTAITLNPNHIAARKALESIKPIRE